MGMETVTRRLIRQNAGHSYNLRNVRYVVVGEKDNKV